MGPSSSCESVPRSCLPHTNPHRLTISHQAFTRAHRLYAVCLLRLYGGITDVLKELFDDWDNDARSEGVVSALYLKKKKQQPQTPPTAWTPGPPASSSRGPRWLAGSSCHSQPLILPHVTQNYTARAGFVTEGTFVTVCPPSPSLPLRPPPPAEQPFHAPA